jgi:hypothetical protein
MEKMDHISNHLPQLAEGSRELTNYSKKQEVLQKILLPEEKEMVNLKYKARRFGEMNEEQREATTHLLLLKLHVITGWEVPLKEFMNILADQLQKKMGESYANVNAEEVEYAFRNNTQVQDWGKAMNLSLIDDVMIPYLEKRKELSAIEEQKAPAGLIEGPKEDLSDKAMGEWLEDIKSKILKDEITYEFIPLMLYDWLESKGKLNISKEEKREYLARAIVSRQARLKEEALTNPESAKKLSQYVVSDDSTTIKGDEVDVVKSMAKRMALYHLLKYTEQLH